MKVDEGILQSVVDNLNEVIVPRAENLRSNVEALEYPSDDPIFPAGGKIDFNFYIDSMWSNMSNAAHAVENFLNLYQGKESENEEIAAILGAEIAGLDGATYMADVWGNGKKGTFSDDGTYTVNRLAMLDKDGKLLLNVDLTDEKYKGKSLDEIKEIVAKENDMKAEDLSSFVCVSADNDGKHYNLGWVDVNEIASVQDVSPTDSNIGDSGNVDAEALGKYGITPEYAAILSKFGIDINTFENCDLENLPKVSTDEHGNARRVDYEGMTIYANGEYVDNISGMHGILKDNSITYKFNRPEDINDVDSDYIESLGKLGVDSDFAKLLYNLGIDEKSITDADGKNVKLIKDEHGEVRSVVFDDGLRIDDNGKFSDQRTGNQGKINIGNTIDFDITYGDMQHIRYMDTTMDEYLERNNTSIDEVNEKLRNTVLDAGPGTRDGAVAAMLGLVNSVSTYGMKLPYISSTGAGGTASGKYGKYGVAPDWGTYSGNGWYSTGYHHTYHQTGLDCSGAVTWAMHNGGYEYVERNSSDLADLGTKHAITEKTLDESDYIGKPGDLLWKNGHIAMIVDVEDDGYVIAEEVGDNTRYTETAEGLMLNKVQIGGKYSGKDYGSEETFTHVIDMSDYYANEKNKDLDYFK